MHAEVREFVGRWETSSPVVSVIELGSRNTSGDRIRTMFKGTRYVGVDAVPGPDVDVVANAAEWLPESPADLVLCCEMFEHTPRWREVVANSLQMLRRGGRAVFTCAGPDRRVHGVNHDDPDQPGYYANVEAAELGAAMEAAGFVEVMVRNVPHRSTPLGGTDTQATGVRPGPELRNAVVTCLLTSQPDPQRGERWQPDPAVLDTWANSIRGGDPVVLVDEFLREPLAAPQATVQAVTPLPLNPYYARWHHYQKWLRDHPEYDRVWFTDGTDVEMLREPWPYMMPDTLYLGSETQPLGWSWMLDNHRDPHINRWLRRRADRRLLNAGLVGGYRDVAHGFLDAMCSQLDAHPDPSDMGVFNFTAYVGGWAIVTGPRVHTEFKAYRDNGLASWRHK